MGVRVLLADDHPVFRQGLRALLEREKFDVVGEASDGLEAIAAAERLQPQIVVIEECDKFAARRGESGIQCSRCALTVLPDKPHPRIFTVRNKCGAIIR